MKQVIIGDVHGFKTWKAVIARESDFDRVIFIGDYFDSFQIDGIKQLENFLDICEFARTENEKKEGRVILLIGNHDYHYFDFINNMNTSGFQYHMKPVFAEALRNNFNLLQMAFVDHNETVYSHAGLTKTFLYMNGWDDRNPTDTVNFVNELWHYKPIVFEYNPIDRTGYGQHISQSCIWVRPDSLYKDMYKCLQVVGHSIVNKIDHESKSRRRGFFLIDAMGSGQYLTCVDNSFKVQQLSKDERIWN